ncbi:unnamed protein product [Orchesella dallaii]|uniref:Uncharacterized protein n=1 Tax=Orchesella dallaii TaxID=48710 RepID=A0ABP1RGK1_9HEXA
MVHPVSWSETQSVINQQFCDSSSEFIWNEEIQLTRNLFANCILSQCIIINYNALKLEANYRNLSQLKYRSWDFAFEQVLLTNAIISREQKYTSGDLLLISDIEFPTKNAKHFILQAEIDEWFPFKHVTIPTAVVVPTSSTNLMNFQKHLQVTTILTSALLLFIDLPNGNVQLGCFACNAKTLANYWNEKLYMKTFGVTKLTIPKLASFSFEHIHQYWMKLHSNLYFEPEKSLHTCKSRIKYSKGSDRDFEGENCETFEIFFKHTNCSSFRACLFFYSTFQVSKEPQIEFRYYSKVVSFGANHLEFGYQILLPKVNYFEANLSAFLTPFTTDVWLSTIAIVFAISLWLVLVEKNFAYSVIMWQFSVLLEQDCIKLIKNEGRWGKFIFTVWILSAIILRIFYTSFLYSYMTSEHEPTDYPNNLKEIISQYEYSPIVPESFYYMVYDLVESFKNLDEKILEKMEVFYIGILLRSSIMEGDLHANIDTLQNVASGYPTTINSRSFHYNPNETAKNLRLQLRGTSRGRKEIRFQKFAVICEQTCVSKWNVAFFGQTKFHRIVSKSKPFFDTFEFWRISYPNAMTYTFSGFLARFVQSGIYNYGIKRYRMTQQLMLLQKLKKHGMGNGSLFSYVFLANSKEKLEMKEESAKLNAFTGIFIIITGTLNVATMFFILEFCNTAHELNTGLSGNLVE